MIIEPDGTACSFKFCAYIHAGPVEDGLLGVREIKSADVLNIRIVRIDDTRMFRFMTREKGRTGAEKEQNDAGDDDAEKSLLVHLSSVRIDR
jgi:hypothetical protein